MRPTTEPPLVPSRAVLREIAAAADEHRGAVSAAHGFLPQQPPALSLPPSHRAWDEVAARLPQLWSDVAVRAAVLELPHLPAGPEDLPDDALWRASVVLCAIAYSYVRCDLEHLHAPHPVDLPPVVSAPWQQVARRMGRQRAYAAYDDFTTYNWRRVDATSPDPVQLESMHLLVPCLGSDAERAFFGVNIEIYGALAPTLAAVVRAQEAVAVDDRDGLVDELLRIHGAVCQATDIAFSKIDPNPYADITTDPVLWGKLVAPTGVPLVEGMPGVSGAGNAAFQLLDVFLGRSVHASPLGAELRRNRELLSPNVRAFLDAVDAVSVPRYVERRRDRELAGLLQSVLDAYAGDRGYLGVHRRKVYGFVQTAFKTGRPASASGISGGFVDRAWHVVDDELAASQGERFARLAPHPQVARLAARDEVARGGQVQRVTLDLTGTGVLYRSGDRCAVLPEHSDHLVARCLSALGAPADRLVPLTSRWRRAVSERTAADPPASLRLDEVLRIAALRPLRRPTAKALQRLSGSSALRDVVEAREEDRLELWDAIELAAADGYDVRRLWTAELWQEECLTRVLPPEAARVYSISAAPDAAPFPRQLTLTTGRLHFVSAGPDGTGADRWGTGPTYLTAVARHGDPVHVRIVRPRRFSLPEDPTRPVLMVAGGTGLAPFRGFLQEREADPRSGPTWLFVAARTRAELPYADELAEMAARGRIRVVVALSREEDDGQPPRRIDEALTAPAAATDVAALLGADAAVFICGRAAFAATVLDAFRDLAGGGDVGRLAVRRLVGRGRLMSELFTTAAPAQAAGVAGSDTYDVSQLVQRNGADHGWWTAIDGSVYDMTEFRHLHPGGFRILDDSCGLDATSEFSAVLHGDDPEIRAMLAVYKIGRLRRLDLGDAWGIALRDGVRFIGLADAFRIWLRHLYLVVELQNGLRNDRGFLGAALTRTETPEQMTPLKLVLAADLQSRMFTTYLEGAAGAGLAELWALSCGLFDRDADATELPRQLAALRDGDEGAAARRAVARFAAAASAATLGPVPGRALTHALSEVNDALLAAIKDALREGLLAFERHEAHTVTHGGPAIMGALRSVAAAVAAFYAGVVAAVDAVELPAGSEAPPCGT